jgi:hypothetical protein
MLVLGLVITVIGKKIFHDQTVADIGAVTAVMGAGLIAFKGLLLVSAQSKQQQSRSMAFHQVDFPSTPDPRVLTEPPSITENTTKHLDAVSEERSRDTQPT